MNTEITDREQAALEVLRSTGIDVLETALVAGMQWNAGAGGCDARGSACGSWCGIQGWRNGG